VSAFLAMGGYAAYVWPSYAITIIGLGGLIGWTLVSYARAKARNRMGEERRP
jgi:heme exporter protein CcmD